MSSEQPFSAREIAQDDSASRDIMFPVGSSEVSRLHHSVHLSTRQYARILRDWVTSIGLEPSAYGTHSMRQMEVAQIYRKTVNLRAVQLLLGHTKMDSTVRYLDDALTLSEEIDL